MAKKPPKKSKKNASAVPVAKAVLEAEKALVKLRSDVETAGQLLKQDKLTEQKIKPVIKSALNTMTKHKGVTALVSTPGFDDFDEELQKDVLRIEALMNTLLGLIQGLPKAKKMLKKSPEDDYVILIKATKPYAIQIKKAPRHVGQLVKAVKAGQQVEGPAGFSLTLLPALILLWLISETIVRGLKGR